MNFRELSVKLDAQVDFPSYERTATALIRGLRVEPHNWGEMVSAAELVLSHLDDVARSDHRNLYEEGVAVPAIAAARILDSASDARSGIDEDARIRLALLSATAYAMYGNFASATAVGRRLRGVGRLTLPRSQTAALSIAAPPLAPALLREIPDGEAAQSVVEKLIAFLETGEEDSVREAEALFESCMVDPRNSPTESALLRLSRLALSHLSTLAVARALADTAVSTDVSRNIIASGVRVLFPPQYRVLGESDILRSGANALIGLPTSTGKTLLGELCMLGSLSERPGVVCYVTPWVATGRQAAEHLLRHKLPKAKLHRLIGGFYEEEACRRQRVKRSSSRRRNASTVS